MKQGQQITIKDAAGVDRVFSVLFTANDGKTNYVYLIDVENEQKQYKLDVLEDKKTLGEITPEEEKELEELLLQIPENQRGKINLDVKTFVEGSNELGEIKEDDRKTWEFLNNTLHEFVEKMTKAHHHDDCCCHDDGECEDHDCDCCDHEHNDDDK